MKSTDHKPPSAAWRGSLVVLVLFTALAGSWASAADPAPKAQTYQVQPGDTLWGIARRFGITMADLRAANGLAEGTLLRAGQVLTIPAPSKAGSETKTASSPPAPPIGSERRYTVQPGDYPLKIARQFGLPIHDLLTINHLPPEAVLQVGQVLVLPQPTVAQPSPAAEGHPPGIQPAKEASGQERGRIGGARKRQLRLRPKEDSEVEEATLAPAVSPLTSILSPESAPVVDSVSVPWPPSAPVVSAPAATSPAPSRPEPEPAAPPSAPSAADSERTQTEPTPRERIHGLALARTAQSYLGVPFQFGGTSREGLDCSGLVFLVGQEHGLALPRTTAGQFRCGQPVERADLRPGDLVFFNTNGQGVSHVGVYLGGGEFIHVETTRQRQAIVSRLEEPYYRERYVGARRMNPAGTGGTKGNQGELKGTEE